MTGKRLYFMLGVLFIVLVGAFALIFAVLDPQAAQDAALAPLTPTPSGVVSLHSSNVRRVTGTIQSLGNQSLVVALPHGNTTITVNVDALTTYTSVESSASFSALKVGQTIYVRGELDHHDPAQLLALSIVITT